MAATRKMKDRRDYHRAYYLANREKVKARAKAWRENNAERAAAWRREWWKTRGKWLQYLREERLERERQDRGPAE